MIKHGYRLRSTLGMAVAALLLGPSLVLVPTPAGADDSAGSGERSGRMWRSVAGGGSHTCGVRKNSSLWCWGENDAGQLGLGHRGRRLVPTRVSIGTDWLQVSTGYAHTCGIRTDGSLWCWGWNNYGQLGLD